MPKFYDPRQPDQFLSGPMLFQRVPIKTVLISMQLLSIIFQVAYLILSSVPSKIQISIQMASILATAFTVAVFIIEHKPLIRAHFWVAVFFTAAPITFVVLASIQLGTYLPHVIKHVGILFQDYYIAVFVFSILLLCAYIVYLLLCRLFIIALDQQSDDFPELDTTQGLFHYNRDAYDGSERVNLMYPEV